MRFGVCAPLEKIDRLAAVGYDYIELGVRNALMPEASDTEFQEGSGSGSAGNFEARSLLRFSPRRSACRWG